MTPTSVLLGELLTEVDALAGAVIDAIRAAQETPPNMEGLGAARQQAEDVRDAVREMQAQQEEPGE